MKVARVRIAATQVELPFATGEKGADLSRMLSTASDETKVWRFGDLAKLISAIHTRTLYLVRLDRMQDRFEGSIPVNTVGAERQVFEQLVKDVSAGKSAVETERIRANTQISMKNMARLRRALIAHSFVSCWRHGHESEAMWRLYCGQSDGVAIVTAYSGLKSLAVGENTFIGAVNYIDYATQSLDSGNVLNALIHKRKGFEHEQEVRILRTDLVAAAGNKPVDKEGISIQWDPEAVIERIVVSPYAHPWYLEVVQTTVEKFSPKLASAVEWSALYGDPVY